MKIAIILGRGIEGCGVSKFAHEIKEYLKNDCTIYINDHKNWLRQKSIKFEYNTLNNFKSENYDQCWILSLPAKNFSQKNIDFVKNVLENTKCKKVLFQLDHSTHSLIRNAELSYFSEISDIIGVHSHHGDFSKFLSKNKITKPTFQIANPFSFDSHRNKYWKSIEEQEFHTKFIGRAAVWKGIEQLYSLHNNILKEMGCITTLEGMELSIGSLRFWFPKGERKNGIRTDIEFTDENVCKADSILTATLEKNKGPYIFGPYINDQCLHRLSRCMFSGHFTTLKEDKYGNLAEYTLLENIACGTVPFIGHHYMNNSKGFISEQPHINASYSGISVDDDKDRIKYVVNEYVNDSNMRNKAREYCFEYWKSQYDAPIVFNKMFNLIG